MLPWLARAALDVIGEAGFGYPFHSLEAAAERRDEESELARAFGVIFSTARKFRVMTILQVWFPVLRRFVRVLFPSFMGRYPAICGPSGSEVNRADQSLVHVQKTENAAMQQAQATMRKIGMELIERRTSVAADSEKTAEKTSVIEGDKTVFDRDLLSVLGA